jgi:hypothetical protein
MVIFFGASYVMDDVLFIDTFRKLKKLGVRQIIDFHGGYISIKKLITMFCILPTKESTLVRRIFGKLPVNKEYRGKFHGWGRTRGELRRLYRKAGFIIHKEMSVHPYQYVAILHSKKW